MDEGREMNELELAMSGMHLIVYLLITAGTVAQQGTLLWRDGGALSDYPGILYPTLMVAKTTSIIAHCLGVSPLASSRIMCSWKTGGKLLRR